LSVETDRTPGPGITPKNRKGPTPLEQRLLVDGLSSQDRKSSTSVSTSPTQRLLDVALKSASP
jgi:hypothetical protein